MQKEEGLSTKLWLEERENLLDKTSNPALPLRYNFTLSKDQQNAILTQLKCHGFSWETVIHAAWGLLLNRISTTDSVIFGNAHVNAKLEQITVHSPVKSIYSKINETLTARSFLNTIKKQLLLKHGKKNGGGKNIRYLCLLEQHTTKNPLSYLDVSRYTLALLFSEKEHAKLSIAYHPGYFRKENIKKLAQYFTEILKELGCDLDRRVVDIDVMTSEEKEQILHQWSKPTHPFETKRLHQCTHELISEYANHYPEKLAVAHNNASVTFAEIDRYADNLAKVLIESGVKTQENVAVLMDRTPSLIIAMLAIFKVGAVFVPINPKYPNERIEYVIHDSQATCVLVNNVNRLSINKLHSNVISLSQDWLLLPKPTTKVQLPKPDLQNVAYIIYTSGTTGKPKGVMINHSSLTNMAAWYRSCFQITPKDRASQFASQGFDTYICETMPILVSGASVHIVDDTIKLTPIQLFAWLNDHKITMLDLPTAYAQILFAMDWPQGLNLKIMKIGGETCTRHPLKKYSFDIWNCYGPTETTIEATYFKMHHANQDPCDGVRSKTPSIGKIIENGEVYVVDKYMHPVPIGVAGELLIGGECLSPGYFGREDLTREKFIDNVFKPGTGNKLYRTGDLVRWLPDGNLAFIGRIDNQVKIRGYRIELSDIENTISKYPDVREVAVIAKETQNGDKSIIAYITPNLDKERFLYQERCLLSVANTHFAEAVTEDISKYGIALSGVADEFTIGAKVKLHLKLPGFNTSKDITARVIWKIDHRCGVIFDLSDDERVVISKSIDYFLSSHNVMDLVLSASAKRSIRRALKKKLPEYMIPSAFVTLLEFPLTFSGKVDLKALPPPNEYEQILQKHFVPPQTETEKKIADIWQVLLDRVNIGMQDNFFDLGGNSIKAAELSVLLMNEFKVSIPANILFDLPYVPILSQYIDTNGKEYTKQSLIQDDINRDKILHENIAPTGKLSAKSSNPENVLLTGAGGFLGIFMLSELLISTNAKIHCLIRQNEFETAARRLDDTIKKFNLANNISLSNRRIIAIPADLSMEQFGIPFEQYKNMAEKIDLIYHCGAQVNIMASYNNLRGSNVRGTQEIIKFATTYQDKPIHYISTLSSAYLKDQNGALIEEFPGEDYEDIYGGYAISKWVSERLLTELKDRGSPVTIYRSGYISGDSTTGVTSLNDALLMLIKGCIEMGYAPDLKERITILPVDFVSKAIVKLSLAVGSQSSVFHIDHPIGMMWIDLVAWLNDYGYSLRVIPLEDWKKMLHGIKHQNPLYPLLPFYLLLPNDYQSPDVSVNKAASALNQIGLVYPKIDDSLLTLYFNYLCTEGFFSKPHKKKSTV